MNDWFNTSLEKVIKDRLKELGQEHVNIAVGDFKKTLTYELVRLIDSLDLKQFMVIDYPSSEIRIKFSNKL